MSQTDLIGNESTQDDITVEELATIMTCTLAQGGLDRMTVGRIEEVLAVAALTAHL